MNKSLFMLATMITMVASIWAQTTDVAVGNGDYFQNNFAPVNLYYSNSASQTIYLSSEITDTGYINSIKYFNNYTSLNVTRNIRVYMATTSLTQFTAISEALSVNDFVLVYDGPYNIVSNQWSEIDLDVPFHYDGTQNLIVGVEDYTGYHDVSFAYWQSTSGTGRCITATNDNDIVGIACNYGYVRGYYPDIKFGVSENNDSFCTKVDNVVVSNITSSSATVSWTERNDVSTFYYQVKKSSDSWAENGDLSVSTNTVDLLNLDAGCVYNVRIKSDCGSSQSAYKYLNFTTSCGEVTSLPWTTNFENDVIGQIPNCWERLNVYSGYPSVINNSSHAYSGGKMLEFHADTTKSIAILPVFATSLSDLQISFYTRREGGSSGTFYIGYITDITDASTFVVVDSITSAMIGDDNYHLYELPFSNVTIDNGVTSRIAFAYACNYNWYWYVDDITVEEVPACSRPTQITSSITSSTATINWTSTATEFEVYYKTSDATEYTLANNFSATDVSGFYTITLENLIPATQYSYYIKAICEDTVQSEIKTFKTQCVAVTDIPFVCGFETYDTETRLPTCWTSISTNGYSVSNVVEYYPNNGTNSLSLESNSIVVLPTLDTNEVSINSLQIRFYAMSPAYYYNPATVEIGIMSDATDTSTFELVSSIDVTSGTYEEKVVMLSAYQGNGNHIAIRKNGGATYIDDINVESLPDCPPVQDIVVTSLSSESATITWTGNNNSYLVRYKMEEETQWTTDNITSSGASAIISGLSANTNYIVSVAPDCEETADSTYRTSTFTTLCATENVPYLMDFEDESMFGCWTIASKGSDTYYGTPQYYPYIDNTSSNANSPTHSLVVGGASNGGTMFLVAPKVNLNIEQTRLQFCVRKLSLSGLYGTNQFGNIEVGLMTNPNDTNTFVSLATIQDSNITTSYSWQTIDFNQFGQYTGTDYCIAIKYLGVNATWSYACGKYCIDDVKINNIPSCSEVTEVVVSNISSNSVNLSWTSQASDFKVYYKDASASDEVEYSSVDATLTNGSYTLENLQPATTYNFYVATICSDGSESNSQTYTFTTTCAALNIPYTTSFEDIESYSTPLCWSFINSITEWGYTYPCVKGSTLGHSSAKGVEFHSTSDTSTAAIAVLPEFTDNINLLSVSFWTKPGCDVANEVYSSGRLDVGYVTDLTDASTFVMVDTISVYTLTDSAYHKYRVNFGDVDLGEAEVGYIAFRHVTQNSSFYWYLDDVTVDEIPVCSEPTRLISSNATPSSIDLTWTSTVTNLTLYYKKSSETTFDSIENVSLNTNGVYSLGSLQANTMYDWKVAYVCSSNSQIVYSEQMTFTTACGMISVLPQTWDFETNNTAGTTYYPLPACWQRSNGNYPYVYAYSYYAHGGNNALSLYGMGTGILPQIDTETLPINTLQLSLYAKSGYNDVTLDVGVMTDPTDLSTFTTVSTLHLISEYSFYEIPFASYTGTGSYIAIRGTSSTGSMYMDDITLDVIPACSRPNDVVVTATDNQATINWYSTGSNFRVYYKESTATDYDTAIVSVTAGATNDTWSATISGLASSTLYDVYVKAICGEELELQSNVVSFRTECTTVNTFPYTEDFESLSTSDFGCWSTTIVSGMYDWDIRSQISNVAHRVYNYGTADLISPVFNISSLSSPTLSYDWEVCEDFSNHRDSLYVYYRISATDEWIPLASHGPSYTGSFSLAPTQDTTIALPLASTSYQILFRAVGNNGFGVYLDNVVISGDSSPVTPVEPTVATNVASNISQTSATLNGAITDAGNQTITAKGFEWKATNGGTYAQVLSTDNGNTLTYNLSNLTANTSYTYKAFASTANGTVYGSEQVFTTLPAGDEPCTPLTASVTETLCYGETFTFNGQTYNATGTYTTTVTGQNGDCDTLYTINLTILPQNEPINDEVTISQSELPYEYHGQTYNDFGTYSVTTQDENGCDQVYNLTLVHNSGISEVEGGLTISLYPNPTDNNATLRVKGLNEQATIIITDQQGRVVSTKVLAEGVETMEIDSEKLASGVYYIRIQTTTTIRTEKLIKQA